MELKLHLYSITWMFAPRPSIGPWKSDSQMLKPWIFEVRPSMLKPWIFEIRSSAAKALDLLIPTFDAKALDLRSRISDTETLDLRSPTLDARTSIKPKLFTKCLRLRLPAIADPTPATSLNSRSQASDFTKFWTWGHRLP